MAQCDIVEKPMLERIQSELEADPDLCDVTFSVGPQKTKVKTLKIILLAASPVFKTEFKTKWNNAVVMDEEGIPLPEFDGESFQLFAKLTLLDSWSDDVLRKLNLPPNQRLDLLSICRRYEMRTAVKNLEKLTASFLKSFATFKDTADFLKLSQANLKELLASDDLAIEETEAFKCAIKWADEHCKEKKIEASVDNLRHVLRDCLFEIRFPIMSNVDFTNSMELKEILSAEEILKIYKYIGLDASKRKHFDVRSLAFKIKTRNLVLPDKMGSNSDKLLAQQRLELRAQTVAQTFKVLDSLWNKTDEVEREEMIRNEETARGEEMDRWIEICRREEIEKIEREEIARREQMDRRVEMRRSKEMEKIEREEIARREEMKRQMEMRIREEIARREQMDRRVEMRRSKEMEQIEIEEIARREEMKRQMEMRIREEIEREVIARREEMYRFMTRRRWQKMAQIEEMERQKMHTQMEMRKIEEMEEIKRDEIAIREEMERWMEVRKNKRMEEIKRERIAREEEMYRRMEMSKNKEMVEMELWKIKQRAARSDETRK